ncbi:F-box protein-like protein isoform X1 [Salvia divinorum]|uniref:F-box protein-like protein isoform X1 n=1 Tax=Salvia divinorum TaxID=28513 RepID=A0ABD1HPS5_SALDI
MGQDLFRYLPSEIFMVILLRLSPEVISTCRCVCKAWLDLIESDVFHKSHPLALVVSMPGRYSNWFSVFKLEGEHEQDLIDEFDFPQASTILGSVNGLLLLGNEDRDLYVCNPLTSGFVELHGPPSPTCRQREESYGFVELHGPPSPTCRQREESYGFGVSKISGQYKVVCHDYRYPKYEFHVYTLEAGSSLWRVVEAASPLFDRCDSSVGSFASGNLHWLVSCRGGMPYVCCFDLETECFSTFSLPPNRASIEGKLCTLGDYLCFYDDEGYCNVTIWLLKEYEQADKRWIEVLKVPHFSIHCFHPIKVYENGNMMLWRRMDLLYYSNESGKVREIGSFRELCDSYQRMWYAGRCDINSICLTPSYLHVKRVFLGMENIISF